MPARSRSTWFPRLLFRLTLALSTGLILMVFLAPLVDNGEPAPKGAARVALVFARDPAMRRTAIAGALGLLVTACIFFRPPRGARPPVRRAKPPRMPPPQNIAGA
jgi:hypothetical protein